MVFISGWLLLVVRLGLAMALPRTTEDGALEVVERSDRREPQHIQHKFLHRRHHMRHRSRGPVPPEGKHNRTMTQ